MIHYIENEKLKIGVKEFACELTSVILKENDTEYLWQGDEKYWSGQSPILFPIVGRLFEDTYFLDGKKYSLPKHGFARNMPWTMSEKKDSSISFTLRENEDTLLMYPYAFTVTVTFSLEDNRLKVAHEIKNENDKIMYASLGAHPAFNCQLGDRLVFGKKETLEAMKIDFPTALRLKETFPVLNNEDTIVITEDTFKEDALIFNGVHSDSITLESDKHSRKVLFKFGTVPYLGLWAKPGAPYVCIEPWCGVNDSMERKEDLSKKDAINAIAPLSTFLYTWEAEFIG